MPEMSCNLADPARSGCSNKMCDSTNTDTGGNCGPVVGCNVGYFQAPECPECKNGIGLVDAKLDENNNTQVYLPLCANKAALLETAQRVRTALVTGAAKVPDFYAKTLAQPAALNTTTDAINAALKADRMGANTVAVLEAGLDANGGAGLEKVKAGVGANLKADIDGAAASAAIVGVLVAGGQAANAAAGTVSLLALSKAKKEASVDAYIASLTSTSAVATAGILDEATQDSLIDGYTATLTAAGVLSLPGDDVKKSLRDRFEAMIVLPKYATDDKIYCPAYPRDEISLGSTGPLVIDATTGTYRLHQSQVSNTGSKGFQYCWTSFHENHKLSKTYGGGGLFKVNKTVFSERTPIWTNGKLQITKVDMKADYLQYGTDFVNIIKEVRAALLEDTELVGDREDKTDGDLFPTGIPFVFWEQYVELLDHLLLKSIYAGAVVLGTVTVLLIAMLSETADKGIFNLVVASLHGALLVVLMCMVTMIEVYGFMGIMKIKLNAIPQVTLIMAIGVTVEFTAHILLAYLNAPNPASNPGWSFGSRKARTLQSLAKMGVPSIHGAITTFLGIVMLANADTDFIVLYYFMLYFLLVVFGIVNGLLVLPAILVLVGPGAVCTEGIESVSKSAVVPFSGVSLK